MLFSHSCMAVSGSDFSTILRFPKCSGMAAPALLLALGEGSVSQTQLVAREAGHQHLTWDCTLQSVFLKYAHSHYSICTSEQCPPSQPRKPKQKGGCCVTLGVTAWALVAEKLECGSASSQPHGLGTWLTIPGPQFSFP